MGKEGNWTHGHRAVRERMISRGFKERGNITITIRGTVRDTNEISRKGANVSESQGQPMKTAGSGRMKGRGRKQVLPVDEIKHTREGVNLMSGRVGHQYTINPDQIFRDCFPFKICFSKTSLAKKSNFTNGLHSYDKHNSNIAI